MSYVAVPAALRRAEETPLSEKIAWSLPDVARATGLSTRTIQNAIARGELKPVKIGRRTLLRPADVRAWLDSQLAN